MRIVKEDIINFNIDYIELFWTLKNYKEVLKWIDDDNSNIRIYNWYTVAKTENLRNYQYKITFWKDNTPVFAWYLWDVLNMYIETKDYFVVYWSAFNLLDLAEIVDFINENIIVDYWSRYYINNLNNRLAEKRDYWFILKRVDLALDVIKPIWEIVKNFRELKSKWSKFYDDKWNIQTYYIWEKKNTLNKNLLIRIYDKIADIKQKEKQYLYPTYLKENYVTRIELEFRSESLKFLKLEQLLDRSYIFWIYTSYLLKHTHIFDKLKDDTPLKLKKLNKRITVEDLHSRQLTKNRYLNTFLWYSRKFLHLGSCPVDILIREWIISNRTKRDIASCIVDDSLNLSEYRQWVTERNLSYLFANNEDNKNKWN